MLVQGTRALCAVESNSLSLFVPPETDEVKEEKARIKAEQAKRASERKEAGDDVAKGKGKRKSGTSKAAPKKNGKV